MKRTSVQLREQDLINESNLSKILRLLYLHPETEFSLTEIADGANVSKSAVNRALTLLEEHKLIIIAKKSIVYRISANSTDFGFQKRKIAWNLTALYNSTVIEFLDEQFHHPKAIILFGSFRYGKDSTGSDIDIAVEIIGQHKYEVKDLPQLLDLEQGFSRKFQIHVFSRSHIDENVFANIANGIVLSGFLEVHK